MNSQGILPEPVFKRNDSKARMIIWLVSIVVFCGIAFLSKVKAGTVVNFNPHVFATLNAILNSGVAILLLAGIFALRSKSYLLHKRIMLAAILLSVLFLISYVCHHFLSGDTRYGDMNHDGIVSLEEKSVAGSMRYIYYLILITHIPLAAVILPFILFTAYRSLSGDYVRHKKLARITWPVWLYVAISGVVVYLMIRPYYT